MIKRLSLYGALLAATLFAVASPVAADITVEVSGNGEGTNNSVSVSGNSSATVTQNNDANVTNNTSQESNSGNNTISDSSGNAAVTTGDVSTQTTVSNNVNQSDVVMCDGCNTGNSTISITVSGNGNNSVNTVHTTVSTPTTVTVSQNANVTNNIGIKASSGANSIYGNLGNAGITTGNVYGTGIVKNAANQASLMIGKGAWDITIINKNNGEDSVNVIYLDVITDTVSSINHFANIKNNVYADLTSGDNKIFGTIGDAFIDTGDVSFEFDVSNEAINTTKTVICCDNGEIPDDNDEDDDDDDNGNGGPGDNPSSPPTTGSTNPTTNGKGGDILAALAQVLPATGASALHFWMMLVVYFLLFLSGLYLRLRAGRSPTYAYNYYRRRNR